MQATKLQAACEWAANNLSYLNLSSVPHRIIQERFKLNDDAAWKALDYAERADCVQSPSIAEEIAAGVTPAA